MFWKKKYVSENAGKYIHLPSGLKNSSLDMLDFVIKNVLRVQEIREGTMSTLSLGHLESFLLMLWYFFSQEFLRLGKIDIRTTWQLILYLPLNDMTQKGSPPVTLHCCVLISTLTLIAPIACSKRWLGCPARRLGWLCVIASWRRCMFFILTTDFICLLFTKKISKWLSEKLQRLV